jgi:K+ transporter
LPFSPGARPPCRGFFGPITAVWFLVMGVGGINHIFDDLGIFAAFNPYYACCS